jgi:hypothetical protein
MTPRTPRQTMALAPLAAAFALLTGTAVAAGLPLGMNEVDKASLPDAWNMDDRSGGAYPLPLAWLCGR